MALYYTLLFLIAAVDLKFRIIPKGLNIFCISTVYCHLLGSQFASGELTALCYSILYGVAYFLFYSLLFRVSKGALGYGDVRLAPAIVDFQSLNPSSIHLLAWVLAGSSAIINPKGLKSLPFAPFLLGASIIINH